MTGYQKIGWFNLAIALLCFRVALFDYWGWVGFDFFAESFLWHLAGFVMLFSAGLVASVSARKRLYLKPQGPVSSEDESLHKILRMARQRSGKLTALGVAVDLQLDLKESEHLLELLVQKGLAEMDVSEQAVIVFRFPDFEQPNALPPRSF